MQNWDSRKARAFLANSNHFRVPVPAPALRLSILPATHPPLRVALSHYAAGNFELARNSPDEVVEQYQATLNFAARDPNLLLANSLSLAYVHLVRSEYTTALGYLDRVCKIAPESAAVAQLSGWAYYGLDRLPEATAKWQRSQKISRGIAQP